MLPRSDSSAHEAPPGSRRRWAGVAPDDRRAERRRLLIAAARDLLGTVGWSGTTVRAVCQAARLNPRYFYESFGDLDALVVALYDSLVVDLRGEIEGALARAAQGAGGVGALTTEAIVRATVETTVRFVDDDRRRGRVLYGEALGNEALNRRRIESSFAVADLIAAGLDDSVHLVAAAIVVGGFAELLMAWLEGRIKISRRQLIDDATALFVAVSDAAVRTASERKRGRRRGVA